MAGMKDFTELKGLRDRLKEDGQAQAIEKAAREKRERQARERAAEFRTSMQGVHKLPESDRYVHRPVYQAPDREAVRRAGLSPEEETADVLRASMLEPLSDEFDVDGMLGDDPALSYTRDGVGPDVVKKLRKRHWPIQDELDLHGLTRDGARDALTDFLHRANRRGARCVRIIHGIGYGSPKGEPVLRSIVHSWLVQKNEVIAFCVAGHSDGGAGALVALLRSALIDLQ